MNKREIISCGISGLRLTGRDVAKMPRGKKGMLVMRHNWEGEDGRAWNAAWEAVREWAHALADKNNRSVEIYAPGGYMLGVIEPDEMRDEERYLPAGTAY